MIGIIDYGISNLHSVKNACDFLNLDSVVSKMFLFYLNVIN